MLVFVMLVLAVAVVVVVVVGITGHAVADCTACRSTQTGTHGASGRTTDTVAYDLTACGAQAATDGCLGLLPVLGAHRAAGCTPEASADRGTGGATHGIANHTAQGTAQTAAHGRVGSLTGHCGLNDQKVECNYGYYFAHNFALKLCT